MNADFDITGIKIETPRLILRGFEEKDLNDFNEYAKVEGVGEMAGWAHHASIEESQRILDHFLEGKHTFAIVFKENYKVIGSLGIELYKLADKLTEFDELKGRELGFVLSKDYWGQGLMTEAVKKVIDYLFNELDYDFLICSHFNRNLKSKRVQEKCGFKPYRSLIFDTRYNTQEPGTMNLLLNPHKRINLVFSHPETLIYEKNR